MTPSPGSLRHHCRRYQGSIADRLLGKSEEDVDNWEKSLRFAEPFRSPTRTQSPSCYTWKTLGTQSTIPLIWLRSSTPIQSQWLKGFLQKLDQSACILASLWKWICRSRELFKYSKNGYDTSKMNKVMNLRIAKIMSAFIWSAIFSSAKGFSL